MAKTFPEIDDALQRFLLRQHVFFVATAPAGSEGHINLSPKGLDGLRVLGPLTVAYLDYPGSGVETIAHLRQNGRITLLFCAFQGPPRIVRLHGQGRVLEPADAEYAALLPRFHVQAQPRAIISIAVQRIADSCGYGVPRFDYVGERPQLIEWGERKGPDGVRRYQQQKNAASLDGLPGLRWVAPDPKKD